MAVIENVQIAGVEPAQGKRGTYWKIRYGNDQIIMVFDASQRDAATALIGQYADIETQQNGQYQNFVAIRPTAGTAPAQAAQPATGGRGKDPEVESRIVRQSSMATAFRFVGHLYSGAGPEALGEAKGVALALAKELFGHAFGSPQTASQSVTEASEAVQPVVHVQPQQGLTAEQVVAEAQAAFGPDVVVQGAPNVAQGAPPTNTPKW